MPRVECIAELIGWRYRCDACNKGEMISTSAPAMLTEPPQYQHRCSHCGAEQSLQGSYPAYAIAVAPMPNGPDKAEGS